MDSFCLVGSIPRLNCLGQHDQSTRDVEDRVIELLGELADGSILRNTGIGEHNIALALLSFDLRQEAVKIANVSYVSLGTGYIFSNLLYLRSQLRITPGYEDIRAFVHKLLRGGKANAAIAT